MTPIAQQRQVVDLASLVDRRVRIIGRQPVDDEIDALAVHHEGIK